MMKKFLLKLITSVALLFILLVALGSFLITTTSGLYLSIKLLSLYTHSSIEAHGLQGQLHDHFSISKIHYKHHNLQVTIQNLRIKWRLDNLLLQPKLFIKELQMSNLTLQTAAKTITLKAIHSQGSITKQLVTLTHLRSRYEDKLLQAELQFSPVAPYHFNGLADFNHHAKPQKRPIGHITVVGDQQHIKWQGSLRQPFQLETQGHLDNFRQIEGQIQWHGYDWPNVDQAQWHSQGGLLSFSGHLPNLQIDLTSQVNQIGQHPWQIKGLVEGDFPWSWHYNIKLLPPTGAPQNTGLFAPITVQGTLSAPNRGTLTLQAGPGHYQITQNDPLRSLAFHDAQIHTRLTPTSLNGKGILRINDTQELHLNFSLPDFKLEQGLPSTQIINANLSLMINSLAFLENISPELKNPKGRLSLSINTHGPLKHLQHKGQLTLNEGQIEVPFLGLHFNNINFTLNANNQHITGQGSIATQNKTLSLHAQGQWSPTPTAQVLITGTDFPIANTHQYQIQASPKLTLHYQRGAINLQGNILIPQAKINIPSFSNSISLPTDVVFKEKQQATPPSPLNTEMNIQVSMGDQVELNAKGLHALLSGTVQINQRLQSTINATGELNVVTGDYKAYGQKLNIDQGELLFTGGSIDNPGINLRASKSIDTSMNDQSNMEQLFNFNNPSNPSFQQGARFSNNMRVGVEVTGRLTQPKIQLFSIPAILSQADILSMLILGKPASQANQAGGQLLLAALSSMNWGEAAKSTQLIEQLKQNLGLDVSLQSNSNYNLLTNTVSDNTGVVVSKTLSKRISLSYNVGLSQNDSNLLTLKYLLNKFFSIQISSSTNSSGMDVLYTSHTIRHKLKHKDKKK